MTVKKGAKRGSTTPRPIVQLLDGEGQFDLPGSQASPKVGFTIHNDGVDVLSGACRGGLRGLPNQQGTGLENLTLLVPVGNDSHVPAVTPRVLHGREDLTIVQMPEGGPAVAVAVMGRIVVYVILAPYCP